MSLWSTIRFAVQAAELGKVPRWRPERVERVAQRRLRRLVRRAAARAPYFARKYRGIDLNRFQLTDLPPTRKEDLREHFDDTVTDPAVRQEDVERFLADGFNRGRWFLDRYAVSHTSGSQGPPLLILQDRQALEVLFGIMSSRAKAGGSPSLVEGWRRLRSPARLAIVVQHRGFYPSAAAFEFMPQIAGPFVRLEWFSATDRELVGRLNEFQPNALVAYASVLEALALQGDGLELGDLRQIGNSSEQLTERAKARIQRAFGVPIIDHYGAGECLMLADGCPTHGGAHVNADWAILEVVDNDYRPVPPGELGQKVLITNLANRVQPFIRYEVSDRVAMATEPCACGSRLPRIARIEGRAAEAFWYRDARGSHRILPGVLFHSAVDELGDVREWRAVQTERNQVELQVELLGDHEDGFDAEALVRRLRSFGLPREIDVDVELVLGLLPDRQSGKFRRMVSQVGPPDEMVEREKLLAG